MTLANTGLTWLNPPPHHAFEGGDLREAASNLFAFLQQLDRSGATVMVCGGRDMAVGVSAALAEILAPAGLTPALLKAEGRYVEDVY